jgi:hypothetical protein
VRALTPDRRAVDSARFAREIRVAGRLDAEHDLRAAVRRAADAPGRLLRISVRRRRAATGVRGTKPSTRVSRLRKATALCPWILGALSACTPTTTTERIGSLIPRDAEIRLHRETNGGTAFSPDYEVVFRGDGSVTFQGFRGVLNRGPVEDEVDLAKLQAIWLRLLEASALRLDYRRLPRDSRCNDHYGMFDLQLRLGGSSTPVREIRNSAPCRSEDEARLGLVIDELEALVDLRRLIGTVQQVQRKTAEEMRRR